MNKNLVCPCGSGLDYVKCCQPFHDGKSLPETAEALMRSRYSAYVLGKIDYIAATNDPLTNSDFDAESANTWSKESEWMGLEVLKTHQGLKSDATGTVEFKANYKVDGKLITHHEVGEFRFDADQKRWFYVKGKDIRVPEKRTEPKLGRNDPCVCGSGKKFKKCCG